MGAKKRGRKLRMLYRKRIKALNSIGVRAAKADYNLKRAFLAAQAMNVINDANRHLHINNLALIRLRPFEKPGNMLISCPNKESVERLMKQLIDKVDSIKPIYLEKDQEIKYEW